MEKNRLESTAGYLFRDFNSLQDYMVVVKYADELGWVVWRNEMKRMFFCREEGMKTVTDFVKRNLVRST
jgi:transcription initiation factor TFIIH subunit 4